MKKLVECAEPDRLHLRSTDLYSQYVILRDELKQTNKNSPSYQQTAEQLRKVQGQLREAHKNFQQHIKDHKCR
jgi:hypothetical protein